MPAPRPASEQPVGPVAGTVPDPATRAGADPERVLRRLEWTVLRRLDGMLQGDYRSLLRGFGLDLADLREYQPHDDVRHIDWNVTARLQVPHVREYQEDREVAAWFLLDLSRSVDFGSGNVRKRDLLVDFAGVLARLLVRRGNRIGALLYRHGPPEWLPPRSGRRQVLALLDRVLAAPPAGASSGETDLADLLDGVHRVIRRRSVVFLVSDFLSRPGWERGLALLARRHEVVAVRLFDPLEMELPDLGFVVLEDAETDAQLFVDTHDRGFRERFAVLASEREQRLRAGLAAAGVDCLELVTGAALDAALLRFVRLRKRRSQLAGGGVPAAAMRGDR